MTLSKARPSVSIVMPVRNEATSIVAVLEACTAQTYGGDIEVVIADAMSSDGTRTAISAYTHSISITLVDNRSLTTPAGLNTAIASSTGEVLVRCDAHSELPPNYVATAVSLLEATGAVNVGGVQRAVGITPVQRAIAAAMSSPFGVGDAHFHIGGPAGIVDTVYLGVFRRDAIEAAGGFDETLIRNQDYELNYRLRQDGGKVYFDPSLEVVYRPRTSLRALWRQYFQYGRWKRVVVRRHPGSTRWRQLVAPAFVIGLVLSIVAVITGYPLVAAVVPGAYLITNLVATLAQMLRRRDVAMIALPAAFAVMHLAWGIGFLLPNHQSPRDA